MDERCLDEQVKTKPPEPKIPSNSLTGNRRAQSEQFSRSRPKNWHWPRTLDLTNALPNFLLSGMRSFSWSPNGTWAFDRDESVTHYVDIRETSCQLSLLAGAARVQQLKDVSSEVHRCVQEYLPREERSRLTKQGKRFVLDLAELRVSDGTKIVGTDTHIDLSPREAMGLIISLHGGRPKVFGSEPAASRWSGVGDLITAFDRWATFHSHSPRSAADFVNIRTGTQFRTAPSGLLKYLQSEAQIIPRDMRPQ